MDDGEGLGVIYPALGTSAYIHTEKASLPCLVRHGKRSTQLETVYMPAHTQLSDLDMINLINYMSYRWGAQDALSPQEIKEALSECP